MTALLADHVWQSTLFAAVAALLTLALRGNGAQVRHWLWLAASVKFLVPFAALVALGRQFGWRASAPVTQPVLTLFMDSDLKKRIEGIMRGHTGVALRVWKKALLLTAGIAALAGPVVAGALNAPPLRAQTQTPASAGGVPNVSEPRRSAAGVGPKFEVASIKQNKSATSGVRVQVLPGGRYNANNVTLFQLIRDAYRLQNFQVSGGPGWINVDKFDIVAIAESGNIPDPFAAEQNPGAPDPLSLMLRALLAERFKVSVHTESREGPIFALLMARSDGRPGPQLKKAAADCAAEARARGNAPPPDFPSSGQPNCGIRMGPGIISAGSVTLNQLSNVLSGLIRRTVVDKTALGGTFDFDLHWTPDQPVQKPGALDLPTVDPNGPSIFTAVQEQLGLKLDSQTGAVEVLVIDRAERPTEN